MTNFRADDLDEDLTSLRGDCARMAPHWTPPEHAATRPVPPSLIHGVRVPARSARLLDAMSDYGD
ncbi:MULTISPECIES: hypothetical protein [Streptomyces]|uniref:hypothetical protein n=1 Tax=Streptomyces TaxID=1883 RepID=UPI001C2E81CA|nr:MULTISPECIES: hypothetical protein [Streptomyces]MBV1948680.1 hypothetical protein [Streptomyces sp. BV129]WUB89098.1 hypothetical protein OG812_21975 [Streptomyces sp. NBC_00566]BDH04167.1 hypothetical protein HEK131_13940 [Streptomyces seoulensis]